MSSLDLSIIGFLKKSSRRIKLNILIDKLSLGLMIALALASALTFASLFVPFYESRLLAWGALALGFIISLIWAIKQFPDKKKAALITDSYGLSERLSTSLEHLGKEDSLSHILKRDTLSIIEEYNLKESMPLDINKKRLITLTILVPIFLIGLFLPTEAKVVAKQKHEFKLEQKAMKAKLEEEKKKVEKIEALSKEQKDKLIEAINKAEEEIKLSQSTKEMEKALERLDKKIENLEKEVKDNKEAQKALKDMRSNINPKGKDIRTEKAKKDINTLKDKLSKSDGAEDLLKALESGNKEELEKSIGNINDSLSKMGELEKAALSSELKNAAGKVNSDKLRESLMKASKEAKEGKLSEDTKEQLKDSLGEVMEEAGASQSKGGNSSEGSKEGSGTGESSGNKDGQGDGNGSGSGQGNGSGSGSGSGEGAGWNQGSKKGLKKNNEEGNKEGEQVYVPGRDMGKDENLTGQSSNNSSSSQIVNSKEGLTERGGSVDYSSVIGDYLKEAYENMDNSPIPEALKDIIKSYFEGLQ